jgi:hypothetical protein
MSSRTAAATKRPLVVFSASGDAYKPPPKLAKVHRENEPSANVEPTKFYWRGDPDETFSDWKIEIVAASKSNNGAKSEAGNDGNKENAIQRENVTATYHVHKYVLAYGPRSSDYLAKLFRNTIYSKEIKSCTTRIVLEPLAAKVFPCMLEFMYGPANELQISIEEATALHYLGDYFEIHSLRQCVQNYCETYMTLETVLTFYEHATILSDGTILDLVATLLAKDILKIHPNSSLLTKIQPPVWLAMVDALPGAGCVPCQRNTRRLSRLVLEVATQHKDTMTYLSFQRLTDANKMPCVDPSVAVELCELENHFQRRVGIEYNGLCSLQKRCSIALSEIPTCIGLEIGKEGNDKLLLQQNPKFLVDLISRLVATRKDTRQEMQGLQQELEEATEELEETRDELTETESGKEDVEAELASNVEDMEEVRKQVEAAEEELRVLQGFIQRLRPLPSSATTKNDSTALIPDYICRHNPLLAKMSMSRTTQFKNQQQFPVFYYDPCAVVE